jgi:2,4-dienoyl-CoA reductase-like NADH-dependent reductase (Old Yellow Enzyme family)
MRRDHYTLFSKGKIGPLTLSNRLARSATFDPAVVKGRKMNQETLDLYRNLAEGGVGLIITGDFPTIPEEILDEEGLVRKDFTYEEVRIDGIGRLAEEVHRAAPQCKIIAQTSGAWTGVSPSDVFSPFEHGKVQIVSTEEVEMMVRGLAEGIVRLHQEGFDGVQLHFAHGYFLNRFLSPYTNHRQDKYGGSVRNRARIVREIVALARQRVGNFPILIKMNGNDHVPGGLDKDTLAELAQEIEYAGVDAIEISGGMPDCLIRPESELGFPPVPIPEAHTKINSPDKESYFAECAQKLSLNIPIILVGGNRDVERLEAIVHQGKAEFIALCRPLISEPDLPRRWLDGLGGSGTDCISCNACLYGMLPGTEAPPVVRCLHKHDKQNYKLARQWLKAWVKENAKPSMINRPPA